MFEGIACVTPSMFCILLAFLTTNWASSVAFLCLIMAFGAALVGGRYRVPYDVTPDFAGQTFGFTNTIGQVFISYTLFCEHANNSIMNAKL